MHHAVAPHDTIPCAPPAHIISCPTCNGSGRVTTRRSGTYWYEQDDHGLCLMCQATGRIAAIEVASCT